jgi:hypothetical protein
VRVEERGRVDAVTSESEGRGYKRKGGIRIDDKEARFFFGMLYSCWVYAR